LGWVGCALALSTSACRCNRAIETSFGEVALVYDQDGTTITGPNGTYDFGRVGMGTKRQLTVTVENRGNGPLDLDSMDKSDGENLKLGSTLDEEPFVFSLAFMPITVGAGQTQDFQAEFDAPLETDPTVKTKDHAATVVLKASNTAPGAETAQIIFKGTAVAGSCDLPTTLDFGAVAIGDTQKRTIPVDNHSALQATATVGTIGSNSGDDKAFGFAPESAEGMVSIPSGDTRNVVVEFAPDTSKDYVAFVTIKAADACPDVTVQLIGTGVQQVLTCAPNPLDFGYVTPGSTAQGQLTLSNEGLAAVHLSALTALTGTAVATEYKLSGPDAVVVPPAQRMQQNGMNVLVPGTVTLNLTFDPSLLGPRQGALEGSTDLPTQGMLSCPLIGQGGGPDIDVRPTALAFAQVPYFATAPQPFFVTRKVSVQNLGTAPSPPDAKANLHLGQKDATGAFVKPYWKITANNAASTDDQICVGLYDDVNFPMQPCRNDLAPSYDPMVGIVASGAHALLDIPVRITPSGPNLGLDWTVTLYSNDPDHPSIDVHVTAQSVVLPPCQYTVTPAVLDFGLVSPPAYRDLSFGIKNLGMTPSDTCLVTHLDLEPGADSAFSLPAGPVDQQVLGPGQSLNVTVRAWPQGTVGTLVQNALGTVQFGISSPTQPSKEVPLTAQIATACLVITPDDLDFGTVKKDCSSANRVFNVYNTCTTAVTVNSWAMQSAAGEPAGGPDCPGSSPCPEFQLAGSPSFTMGGVIAAGSATPATFTLKYHPINYGMDTGAFVLNVTQGTQTVDYVVTLRGTGDMNGLNTDVFKQDSKPKADILLVIDNSCSMADKQTQLSMNFASFIQYAQTANVDYHLGVVTTDLMATASEGWLVGDPTNPKVLTPVTPNVENLFKTKVLVGITGGGLEGTVEPAVLALTAPLVTGPNAGFLRIDAVLAVVGISDAGDQSPLPITVYENEFRNIKGAQRASLFSFNRIGPFSPTPPAGCEYDDFTDTTRDEYLVQAFNGVKEQICTPNWSLALQNLGKTAFGYRTHFYLTATPDLTGGKVISVTLDKGSGPIPLNSTDPLGSTVWSYDPVSNSLGFESLYVPEPGTTLTVTYYVQCM
jgi:hypothetical protein